MSMTDFFPLRAALPPLQAPSRGDGGIQIMPGPVLFSACVFLVSVDQSFLFSGWFANTALCSVLRHG